MKHGIIGKSHDDESKQKFLRHPLSVVPKGYSDKYTFRKFRVGVRKYFIILRYHSK